MFIWRFNSDIRLTIFKIYNTYFQNNEVSAKNKKLRTIMSHILNSEGKIKEAENTCSRRIQAEQSRDQDINHAQQQKCKLENDFSLVIKELGSGL